MTKVQDAYDQAKQASRSILITKERINNLEKTLSRQESILDKNISEAQKLHWEGHQLDNPALDYAFRYFEKDTELYLSSIQELRHAVKEHVGENVLEIQEGDKLEIGKISGETRFQVADTGFRYLNIPVENHKYISLTTDYEKKGLGLISVHQGIFYATQPISSEKKKKHERLIDLLKKSGKAIRKKTSSSTHWSIDYSGQVFSGQGRNNYHLFIGNDQVKRGMARFGKRTVPQREEKIKI